MEERGVVGWFIDGYLMKQCEEISEDEEKIIVRRSESKGLQVERQRSAPGLCGAQAHIKK